MLSSFFNKGCAVASLALALMCSCNSKTASISSFGILPDSGKDITADFRSALEQCREQNIKCLVLEPGRYDFWPDSAVRREIFVSNTSSEIECPSKVKTLGLLIEDFDGLTIDGNGADLIFHGKQTMLSVIHSNDITLKNFHIDCERPGGSELTIESVQGSEVTIRFHKDSWYEISPEGRLELVGEGWRTVNFHCIEFNPSTEHMTYSGNWDILYGSRAYELEPGLVAFNLAEPLDPAAGIPSTESFIPGNVLTIRDRYRDEVGVLNLECSNVSYENVYFHYLHAIGVISQFSSNLTFDHVYCEPREGSGRVLASSADFLHFSGCSGKVSVLDSRFSGAHDDPINVHGTYLRVEERPSPKELRLRFMHHQTYGMQAFWPGDSVAFVNIESLQPEGVGTVSAVSRLSEREVLLTLGQDVPEDICPMDYVVENISRYPEVEIRGNLFTHTNTRGTLLSTRRKAVIADNEYIRTGMCAIVIAGDAKDWYESGAVHDVLIENNTFVGCGYNGGHHNAIISIEPTNSIEDSLHPVHTNIRITGNRFEELEGKEPLYARSAEVTFSTTSSCPQVSCP